jgi:molecular chaperone HtpG
VITKRFLKFLKEEAKENPEKYITFWKTFGIFLKEGVTTDFEYREELGELLRFQSSKSEPEKLVSLNEYVERMQEGQDKIYYINGPSREALEYGPYVEMFRKKDIEIIYTLEPIDDFVLSHLGTYAEKKLVSADRADLVLPESTDKNQDKEPDSSEETLAKSETDKLCKWMKEILGDKINEVVTSTRLVDSPVMIVNADGYMTSSMERVLRATSQDETLAMSGKKNIEINPANKLIKKLARLIDSNEDFAKDITEQIYDNAMIQAGLLVDSQKMVSRNYRILDKITEN